MRVFTRPTAPKNPFRLSQSIRQRIGFLRSTIILAVGILALTYWLFLTPAFAIETIHIEGDFNIARDTVVQLIKNQLEGNQWGIISKRNINVLDSKNLLNSIKNQFIVERVAVNRDWPHTLRIKIEAPRRLAIWSSRGRYFILDSQGLVVGEVAPPKTSKDTPPIIYDQSNSLPSQKDQVLNQQAMAFIAQLRESEMLKTLRPQFFIIEKPKEHGIMLKAGEGWQIRFDMSGDLTGQLQNLDLTLRNTIPPDKRGQLDYIDLRFGERVYFKYK